MNTNALIGLVALIAVVGGGVWFFSNKNTEPMSDDSQEMTSGAGTFAELMAHTGSWKCDVTTSQAQAPSTGTAYISDGKVRADFTSEVNGSSVTSHMISADGYVYTWSDAYPQGMKMMIPEGETTANDSAPTGIPADENVDYSCSLWLADAGMFTPPASVSFMELGENGIPGGYPMPQ